jgi:hypothetical protein
VIDIVLRELSDVHLGYSDSCTESWLIILKLMIQYGTGQYSSNGRKEIEGLGRLIRRINYGIPSGEMV